MWCLRGWGIGEYYPGSDKLDPPRYTYIGSWLENALMFDVFKIPDRTKNNMPMIDIEEVYADLSMLYVNVTHYFPSFRTATLRWAAKRRAL